MYLPAGRYRIEMIFWAEDWFRRMCEWRGGINTDISNEERIKKSKARKTSNQNAILTTSEFHHQITKVKLNKIETKLSKYILNSRNRDRLLREIPCATRKQAGPKLRGYDDLLNKVTFL